MKMRIFNLLADVATATNRKWIYIVLAILLCFVLLIGFLEFQIRKKASIKAKEIDTFYVSDYVKEGLLKTPNDIVKYVKQRETRNFYMKNRIVLRIFFGLLIIYVIFMNYFFNNNYAESFKIIDDLFFKFDWHLVTFYRIFQIPSDFPTLLSSPVPHLTFQGYSTYIMFLASVAAVVIVLINGINLTAKVERSKKIAIDVFGKTIDTSKEVNKF